MKLQLTLTVEKLFVLFCIENGFVNFFLQNVAVYLNVLFGTLWYFHERIHFYITGRKNQISLGCIILQYALLAPE